MEPDVVLQAEGVSKKFCRSLKRAMWYSGQDLLRDVVSLRSNSETLRPEEFWAVDDVSFQLKRGECLGLVGPNGAGKSTLFKIVNGILRPDRGTVRVRGSVGALIEVGAGFHPQLTGRENIYVNAAILGMSRREVDRKFDAIVDFAEIGEFLDSPVKFYSSGMYVRLGMAVAVHTEPQILLIDEVLAVGDINFQAKCLNRIGELRRRGVSFVLVSHNIHSIGSFSHRVLVLDHGKVVALGPPDTTLEAYVQLMESKRGVGEAQKDDLSKGSGRIRFCGVRLCDEAGRLIDRVHATAPVQLKVDYESSVDCKDAELDILVYGSRNAAFFQGSNRLFRQPLSLRRGAGRITVRFACLPINGDKLMFTVALWDSNRIELFDWRRELTLTVVGCPQSLGSAWIRCSFEATSNWHSHAEGAVAILGEIP